MYVTPNRVVCQKFGVTVTPLFLECKASFHIFPHINKDFTVLEVLPVEHCHTLHACVFNTITEVLYKVLAIVLDLYTHRRACSLMTECK